MKVDLATAIRKTTVCKFLFIAARFPPTSQQEFFILLDQGQAKAKSA